MSHYSEINLEAFVNTIRLYLQQKGQAEIAELLVNASCEVISSGTYNGRNQYYATMVFTLTVSRHSRLTKEMEKQISDVAIKIFPSNSGLDFTEVDFGVRLEKTQLEEGTGLNVASLVSVGKIEHDGLRFRSKTETKVYDALKKRNVLFFPGATAVFGQKDTKREPDFLICLNGKWGILEVMGDDYHQSATADHERARVFKNYGVKTIEFYSANDCYNRTEGVITSFLQLLELS